MDVINWRPKKAFFIVITNRRLDLPVNLSITSDGEIRSVDCCKFKFNFKKNVGWPLVSTTMAFRTCARTTTSTHFAKTQRREQRKYL